MPVGRPLWIERFGIAKSVEHGHDLNHVKLNSFNGFEISCHEFTAWGELDVESSDITAEIRMAVLGEWVPPQLADVLALQRAEEPETHAVLAGWTNPGRGAELPGDGFDFALSAVARQWPGWVCEPLWHDTLAVAVAKRSHLLAYREVPCQEVLKQPLIRAQSTAGEPWRAVAQRVLGDALQDREQLVSSFDIAMTLVSAGYGLVVAPSARLAGYLNRGIAARPLAGAPTVVMAYLLHPLARLTEPMARFIQRARSVSGDLEVPTEQRRALRIPLLLNRPSGYVSTWSDDHSHRL